VTQEIFLGLLKNGYVFPADPGAISPSTGRTLPDRYIEGTCPICRLRQCARRPMRQLR
jgi:methionyl-tRNA synthetase